MKELTMEQLIFLDNFIYLDIKEIENKSIMQNIDRVLENIENGGKYTQASMTTEQWKSLLTNFKNNPENADFLNNYVVKNYVTNDNDKNGMRAACFVKSDGEKVEDVVTVFRGTTGGSEWKDNVMMANSAYSDVMNDAVNYINNLPKEYGNKITVTGHSKGGNKAQYVTILTDRIGKCVSFDGQGFSKEFIDFYSGEINEKKSKITSIAAKYDYINTILFPIAGEKIYIDAECDKNFALNHCPNKVFNDKGKLNSKINEPSQISKLMSYITQYTTTAIKDDNLNVILNIISDNIVVPTFDSNKSTKVCINYETIFSILYLYPDLENALNMFCKNEYGVSLQTIALKVLSTDTKLLKPVIVSCICIFDSVDTGLKSMRGINDFLLDNENDSLSKALKKILFSDFLSKSWYIFKSELNYIEGKNSEKAERTFLDTTFNNPIINRELIEKMDQELDKISVEDIEKRKAVLANILCELFKKCEYVITNSEFYSSVSSSKDKFYIKDLRNMLNSLSKYNSRLKITVKELDAVLFNIKEEIFDEEGKVIVSASKKADGKFNDAGKVIYDPLIVDLSKKGFELTDIENGVYFDMDKNGMAEKTGWIKGNSAFLALDRNGDGKINDSGELFGDKTILSNGAYAKSGFEALADFDLNHDGIIDAKDKIYSKLLLWRDKNKNGIADAKELITLKKAGISSINLNYTNTDSSDENTGAVMANVSVVKFKDGTETNIGEFKFSSDKIDTKDMIDFSISKDILALPNVRAVGGVHSLHYAMAKDKSGKLIKLVKNFIKSKNTVKKENILTDILYFICDASDIDPSSRGGYIDARQLAVIEKVTDKAFSGQFGANPNQPAGEMLKQAYNEIFSGYYIELISDKIKDYVKYIETKTDSNGKKYTDLSFFNGYVWLNLKYNRISEDILGDFSRYIVKNDRNAFVEFKNYFTAINFNYGKIIEDSCGGYIGTSGNDTITLSSDGIAIGKSGNDILNGSAGDDILYGDDGNDTLNGSAGNDILDGGKGNDSLNGGVGNDTYMFGKGSGSDMINDCQGLNTIKFDKSVTPSDIILAKNGYNLEISIKGTGDKLTVYDYFYLDTRRNLEYIFNNGTKWVQEDITRKLRTVRGTSGDDVLNAIYDNTTFYGGNGNDIINGSAGNDIFYGGKGDDNLNGGAGNDTYIFGKGSGSDMINDCQGLNTIKFDKSVTPSDIILAKNGYNLEISIKGTGDKLTVYDYFYLDTRRNLEYIFNNGTKWVQEDITRKLRTVRGTSGDDVLNAIYDNTTFYGGNGNDIINGSAGNDIFYGGKGNDNLNGGAGNDTYIFGKGSGSDMINDCQGLNTIKFDKSVTPSDIILAKNGYNLEISIKGTGDKLTVYDYFYLDTRRNLEYIFNNGTKWVQEDITRKLRTVRGTSGDDVLNAIYDNTTFYGGNGNDIINGSAGNDIFYGGKGNDSLNGGAGNDTYIFGKGSGSDMINDCQGLNTIKFDKSVTPSDIILAKNGYNLEISIKGTSDKLTVYDYFYLDTRRNLEYIFNNGTKWVQEDITRKLRTVRGTSGDDVLNAIYDNTTFYGGNGDDVINGSAGNDIFYGGKGDDNLNGGAGNDTYIFGKGSGSDMINDCQGLNTIKFDKSVTPSDIILAKNGYNLEISIKGTGDKLTVYDYFYLDTRRNLEYIFNNGTKWVQEDITRKLRTVRGTSGDDVLNAIYDNTTFYGGNGDDVINGSAGNDIFYGGKGNDNLNGGAGNDTYIFGKGSGSDMINDCQGLNTIKFDKSVTPSDIILAKNGYNLEISIKGTGDKLTVYDYFYLDTRRNLEYIFNNGTKWVQEDITRKLRTVRGTSGDDVLNAIYDNTTFYGGNGNDIINGSAGNDIFYGGKGNDNLNGGAGNDTYIFGKGSGSDMINDCQGLNTIKFDKSVTPSDIILAKNGYNLEISIKGTGDKLTVYDYFYLEARENINCVFDDGSIFALNKNDLSFVTSKINNQYSLSYGKGAVNISDSSGYDTLRINADILNAVFSKKGNNLEIALNSNDKVTVNDWYSSTDNQIETIIGNDGYVLTNNQVQLLIENMASYSSNNKNISWSNAINKNPTGVKDSICQIWVKSN